ncbi:MAG TPA: response regulator [Candidatus Acidoferrales bacterium]|nr:response regulator [Candidatus Acidoferrales bacterium]
MAKILVADDNSNVQKTVALALADLGIEVVAVNNGEAAVKKLPDVMPDLVLADIFMPVRNGYEVCEYVKKDSRFSQVPVVLLVGAFDPLDEREAQRVGADGILKKPFVPPDPLIAMVKTLLDRKLGERLVTAAATKSAASKQGRSGGVAVADDHNSAPSVSEESQEEVARPLANRISFGEGNHPVAFSQLLDSPEMEIAVSSTPLEERADNDQILTSARDEALGAPIFWKTENPEQETMAGDPDVKSNDSDEIPAVGWRLGNEALDTATELKSKVVEEVEEPLELVLDEKDLASNQVSTIVEPSALRLQDAASQASLNVEAAKATDLAANPLEWMASVPPPKQEEVPVSTPEWNAAVPEPTDLIEAREHEPLEPAIEVAVVEVPAVHVAAVSPDAAISLTNSEKAVSVAEKSVPAVRDSNELKTHGSSEANNKANGQSTEDTVRSIPKQELSDLAASLHAKTGDSVQGEVKATSAHEEHSAATQAEEIPVIWPSALPDSNPQAKSVEDTAHSLPMLGWAELASNLKSPLDESKTEKARNSSEMLKHPAAPAEVSAPIAISAFVPAASKASNSSLEDTAHSLPKLDWADLAASLQTSLPEKSVENTKSAAQPVVHAAAALLVNGSSAPDSQKTTSLDASSNPQNNGANTPEATSAVTESTSLTGPDPALVEAVVQRVLDKMRPQVVDIITKEFLRPVVQALVHREITKR